MLHEKVKIRVGLCATECQCCQVNQNPNGLSNDIRDSFGSLKTLCIIILDPATFYKEVAYTVQSAHLLPSNWSIYLALRPLRIHGAMNYVLPIIIIIWHRDLKNHPQNLDS